MTTSPASLVQTGIGSWHLPRPIADMPMLAAAGVGAIVAAIVGSTAFGGGDYGQWLMVSRGFNGLSTPAYRDLSDVPPLAPAAIALFHALLGDPVAALHAVALLIVLGMAGALYAVGSAVDGRSLTGLLAVVLGLLVTDQFLDLLAFGALPQSTAVVFLTLAVACFIRALRAPLEERRWWVAGCFALLLVCLSHVATATVGAPVCVAAAAISLLAPARDRLGERLRRGIPLALGFAVVGAYWVFVVAPASAPFVANPASLAYRGPGRLLETLAAYPPTLAILLVGAAGHVAWLARFVRRAGRPRIRDPRTILLAWSAVSWAAFAASAIGGASTDYPRFAPLLVMPLAVNAVVAIVGFASALRRRIFRQATREQALVAIALVVVVIAPFSIASFQTDADGYRLPDDASLAAAASWADDRVVDGRTILAPVREAKWIEGLTGRSTLFTSQVRYAFRPMEWDRSLAASTLLRGDLGLVNGSFDLTLNDSVRTDAGAQPRAMLVTANHGGEWVDLLRLVPASSLVVDAAGRTLVSLPALAPVGLERSVGASSVSATTRWSAVRAGATVEYAATVAVADQSEAFTLDLGVDSTLAIGGLRAELRPITGVALTDVQVEAPDSAGAGPAATLVFARMGQTEPRLRIEVEGGTVSPAASGGVLLATSSRLLHVRVTDLTAGAPSSSLALLDPRTLIDTYGIGAAILRRDPSYEDRRDRLELLGFRVADAEGPYVVLVRAGSGRPAAAP